MLRIVLKSNHKAYRHKIEQDSESRRSALHTTIWFTSIGDDSEPYVVHESGVACSACVSQSKTSHKHFYCCTLHLTRSVIIHTVTAALACSNTQIHSLCACQSDWLTPVYEHILRSVLDQVNNWIMKLAPWFQLPAFTLRIILRQVDWCSMRWIWFCVKQFPWHLAVTTSSHSTLFINMMPSRPFFSSLI